MNKTFLLVILGLLSSAVAVFADTPASKAQPEMIQRGRYLVEKVCICADCHTPRNQDGSPNMDRWLMGAPLGFQPSVPMPVWAPVAPPIAGLPGYTDALAMRVLQTWVNAAGQRLRPPMPEFRLNDEDARAVIAYLRSLTPKSKDRVASR